MHDEDSKALKPSPQMCLVPSPSMINSSGELEKLQFVLCYWIAFALKKERSDMDFGFG